MRPCERRGRAGLPHHPRAATFALRRPSEPGVLLGAWLVGAVAVLASAVIAAQVWRAVKG